MRKLILLIATALSVFGYVVVADQPDKIMKATGAHAGSTAAPGEGTCAIPGCHANATISPGDGVNSFQLGNNETTYTPGKRHTVKIRAQRAGTNRFGFEVVALDKNNKNIGTWDITETSRTQRTFAPIDGARRYYVTHRAPGTMATSSGMNEWTFDWTAPGDYSDSVRFYYVVNATNNDNTNSGDHLFLSSIAFAASAPNSVETDDEPKVNLAVFPNPASNFIIVKNPGQNSSFEVYSVDGNISMKEQALNHGDNRISIGGLPVGKYYVQVKKVDGKKEFLSFVKQ